MHLRRRVSQYGIGLNVTGAVKEGFERIVGCGLVGKRAGWLFRDEEGNGFKEGEEEKEYREVGEVFAGEVAALLEGVDAVQTIEILGKFLKEEKAFIELN